MHVCNAYMHIYALHICIYAIYMCNIEIKRKIWFNNIMRVLKQSVGCPMNYYSMILLSPHNLHIGIKAQCCRWKQKPRPPPHRSNAHTHRPAPRSPRPTLLLGLHSQ